MPPDEIGRNIIDLFRRLATRTSNYDMSPRNIAIELGMDPRTDWQQIRQVLHGLRRSGQVMGGQTPGRPQDEFYRLHPNAERVGEGTAARMPPRRLQVIPQATAPPEPASWTDLGSDQAAPWKNPLGGAEPPSDADPFDLWQSIYPDPAVPPTLPPSTAPHLLNAPGSPFATPGGGPQAPPDVDPWDWFRSAVSAPREGVVGSGASSMPGGTGSIAGPTEFPNLLKSDLSDLPADLLTHLKGIPGQQGILSKLGGYLPAAGKALAKLGPAVSTVTGAIDTATARTPEARLLAGLPTAANALSFLGGPATLAAANTGDFISGITDPLVQSSFSPGGLMDKAYSREGLLGVQDNGPAANVSSDRVKARADALRYHQTHTPLQAAMKEAAPANGSAQASIPSTPATPSFSGSDWGPKAPTAATGDTRQRDMDRVRQAIGHLDAPGSMTAKATGTVTPQQQSLYNYEKNTGLSGKALRDAIQHQLGVHNP